MKIYRIKHKPTGLYVSKSTGYGSFVRLTNRGKLYKNKGPIEKWINIQFCNEINNHDELEWEEYELSASTKQFKDKGQ